MMENDTGVIDNNKIKEKQEVQRIKRERKKYVKIRYNLWLVYSKKSSFIWTYEWNHKKTQTYRREWVSEWKSEKERKNERVREEWNNIEVPLYG